MLRLEDDFFQEEVRCNFTISEMMKRVWAVEMDVLGEIDRICTEYGLTYYAHWGTLLGAVRHKGFIPWDDDIDIAMKRKDYQMLMSVLADELPEGYYISSSYADPMHSQPTTSIMNTKYIITDENKRKRFYGCPYICGIDIVPLDFVPRDSEQAQLHRNLYTVVYSAAKNYGTYKKNGGLEGYLEQVEDLCRTKIIRGVNEENQLWLLLDKIAGLFHEEECDRLTYFPTNICYRPEYYLDKEWFSDTIMMPFENMEIPVPCGYDEILKTTYGDYMTPSYNAGRAHEYPYYKKQEEFLRSHGLL
jgi:lipopolysaccharide cholinephosphotransferase